MKLSKSQIQAIVQAGLLEVPNMISHDEIYDAAYDALLNEAPEVKSWLAEQDDGIYSIVIRGIPGAYFVEATDHDDDGVYSTLDGAIRAVEINHVEFIR